MQDQAFAGSFVHAAVDYSRDTILSFDATSFEPSHPRSFDAMLPPRAPVALHKPMSTTEMCHVTKMFDALFVRHKEALPGTLQIELDMFELEFAGKYKMPVSMHC